MIYYSIPYSTEKNIGRYYNDFMQILPNDNDFACFVDGDTIFTTPHYGHTINEVVNRYPKIGCFTCMTNRVYFKKQVVSDIDYESNDMKYHRDIGNTLQTVYGSLCKDITEPLVEKEKERYFSGCMIMLQKKLWKKIGGFKDGILGVDNELHKSIIEAKEKIYLMQGVYIYHWYRWPNNRDRSHLL